MQISRMIFCGLLLSVLVAACAPQQSTPAAGPQPGAYVQKDTDRGGGGSGY
jgi:hypothetical protein